MKPDHVSKVKAGEDVTTDHDKGIGEERFRSLYSTGCSEKGLLWRVGDTHPHAGTIAEEIPYLFTQVVEVYSHLGDALVVEPGQDVFNKGGLPQQAGALSESSELEV